MWTRSNLKTMAKEAFQRNYWMCVLVSFITALIAGGTGASTAGGNSGGYQQYQYSYDPQIAYMVAAVLGIVSIVIILLSIFVFNPLKVGGKRFYVVNAQENADLGEMLYPFRANYGKTVVTMLVTSIYIFLWSLLLLIPGIIKAYSYRMVPYILQENPDMETGEIIKMSRDMMDGNKWDTFLLDLSFIGWILFGIVTLGLGLIFWTRPYMDQTGAELYLAISGKGVSTGYDSGSYTGGHYYSPANTPPEEYDDVEPMIPMD